jgi:hypothetical protein
MGKPFLDQGVSTASSVRINPVSREKVRARARALALIAGHTPPHVSQADYEQAKRELTGESDWERQEAALESQPESGYLDSSFGAVG